MVRPVGEAHYLSIALPSILFRIYEKERKESGGMMLHVYCQRHKASPQIQSGIRRPDPSATGIAFSAI